MYPVLQGHHLILIHYLKYLIYLPTSANDIYLKGTLLLLAVLVGNKVVKKEIKWPGRDWCPAGRDSLVFHPLSTTLKGSCTFCRPLVCLPTHIEVIVEWACWFHEDGVGGSESCIQHLCSRYLSVSCCRRTWMTLCPNKYSVGTYIHLLEFKIPKPLLSLFAMISNEATSTIRNTVCLLSLPCDSGTVCHKYLYVAFQVL